MLFLMAMRDRFLFVSMHIYADIWIKANKYLFKTPIGVNISLHKKQESIKFVA
jgi:hypothetical protein